MLKKWIFLPASLITLTTFAQVVKEEVIIGDTIPGRKLKEQKTITIRLKGDQAEEKKFVVEIDGDKIKINGKDISELKDIDVNIGRNRFYFNQDGSRTMRINRAPRNGQRMDSDVDVYVEGYRANPYVRMPRNRAITLTGKGALLGIGMEKVDNGVRITNVSEGSAAEKAGLKVDDVITKLDNKEINNAMDITRIIGEHKPDDEIEVVYRRDGKEKKTKAKLGKRDDDDMAFSFGEPGNVNAWTPDINGQLRELENLQRVMPRENFNFNFDNNAPRIAEGFSWNMSRPKLGASVKETEDSKGMEVTDIDEGTVAEKAGLKKGDIITEVDGKKVNTVEEIRDAVNDARDKTFTIKYTRDGKPGSVDVKFPKKLKQTNL
jgi:serine protease Do